MRDVVEASAQLLLLKASEKRKRRRENATSSQTLGNIMVSIIVTGVLGLPYAFGVAGWLVESLEVGAVEIATFYCMILLNFGLHIECIDKLEEEANGGGA